MGKKKSNKSKDKPPRRRTQAGKIKEKANKKKKMEGKIRKTDRLTGGFRKYVFCLGAEDQEKVAEFVRNKVHENKTRLLEIEERIEKGEGRRETTNQSSLKTTLAERESRKGTLGGAGGNRCNFIQGHTAHLMVCNFLLSCCFFISFFNTNKTNNEIVLVFSTAI